MLRDVEAAIGARDLSRATEMARNALESGFSHPLLLNLRAYWFEQEGRYDDALHDLQLAFKMAPRDIHVLNALGLCLFKLDQTEDALAMYNNAVEVEPNFAPAHLNRGLVNSELGNLDAARESYERAHALDPKDPEPLACLAGLAMRRADWNEAKQLVGQVLADYPRHPNALITLASVNFAAKAYAEAEGALHSVISNPNVPLLGRARAQNILGDVYDAQDRVTEAYKAYAAANSTLIKLHAGRFTAPGVATMPAYMRWLTSYFEKASPEVWGPGKEGPIGEDQAAQHVFLVGFPRSGTTLLEQVLRSHPDIVTMEEKPILSKAARDFLATPQGLDRLSGVGLQTINDYRTAYWRYVRNTGVDVRSKVLVDKNPLYSIKLPLIVKMFPRAKVLFALRDPRDVVWSCFRRDFRLNPSTYEFLTLEGAARFYDQVMRLCEIYRAKFQLELHTYRYEEVVENFEPQVRAICDFIGVPWQDSMRNFTEPAKSRAIATPSSTQVARGLYSEGIGQWRHYAKELAPILPVLQPWIERFNYPPG